MTHPVLSQNELLATPHFGPDDLAFYNDQGQVRLVGVVADEPDVRDTYQNLRLRSETLIHLASDAEWGSAPIWPGPSVDAPG